MPIRFSLRFAFVALTVVIVVFAISIDRAIRQQRAISVIQRKGGTVYYDAETPSMTTSLRKSQSPRANSLYDNLRHDVTQVEITFYAFDEQTRVSLEHFGELHTIRVVGHDSEFGTDKIRFEYPDLEVVDVPLEWRRRFGRWRH